MSLHARKSKSLVPRSIAESHYAMGRAQAALGKFAEAETSLNSAAAVLEDRRANLAKMEPSAHISEEMEDLEELIDDVKEVMVEHKNMAFTEVETLKRKLSSSSPSGKVVEVANWEAMRVEVRTVASS